MMTNKTIKESQKHNNTVDKVYMCRNSWQLTLLHSLWQI